MKYLSLILASVFCLSASAVELRTVDLPLKSDKLIALVQESVEGFLNYEGADFVTEVVSGLKDPKIVIIERDGELVNAIEVTSSVDVDVMVPEYLEVLATRSTFCQTRLERDFVGVKAVGTFCDFDPSNSNFDFYQTFDGTIEE